METSKVFGSCQSCQFDGEVEISKEAADHLLVVNCPKCNAVKSFTPRAIEIKEEETKA